MKMRKASSIFSMIFVSILWIGSALAQGPGGGGGGPQPPPSPWILNGSSIYYNQGGVIVGNPSLTGGSEGVGTINVSGGYYVNGVPLSTVVCANCAFTNVANVFTSPQTIMSASASAFAVGLNGATHPSFIVNDSTALQAAGISITGAVTGGTVSVAAIDSGSNTNIQINAKGTGNISIGNVSTGNIVVGNVSAGDFMVESLAAVFTTPGSQSLVVGPNGTTNPTLQIDDSATSAATGIYVTGKAAGNGVSIAAISSATNENITIDAKGSGTISLGQNSTGVIQIERSLNLGIVGSVPGAISFVNATSGAVTLTVPTGALANGLLILPNVTSDTLVARATTDTLTNKTLSNPILAGTAPTAAGALGFTSSTINFGDGSVNHLVASLDQTQTFTNKAITSPTISSPALSGTATGNFTLSGNITHSGQLIETGTSAPSSAAGNTVVMGTIAAPTLSNNGQAILYNTAVNGAVVQGQGSTYDSGLGDNAGAIAIGVSTGTVNLVALGGITAASLATSGTIGGSLCQTSAGLFLYKAGVNCFTSGAATSIAPGTTALSPTTSGTLLYDNAGVVGEATVSTGIVLSSGALKLAAPYFAYNLSANATFTSGGTNLVHFNTKISDTNSWYDNATNFRYTPQLAGTYRISVHVTCDATTVTQCSALIFKNGSSYAEDTGGNPPTTTSGFGSSTVTVDIALNGSTDFVDGRTIIACTGTCLSFGGTAPIFGWIQGEYISP